MKLYPPLDSGPDHPALPQSLLLDHDAILSLLNRELSTDGYHNYTLKKNRFFQQSDFERPLLSLDELMHLNKMKTLKKQVEWLAGRILIKEMVSRHASCPLPDTITIGYKPEGAPFLVNFPGLKISLTHAGDLVAAGLCTDPDLDFGIDLEKADRVPDDYFLKTAFTRKELDGLPRTPESIFRQWTRKEAFLKFIGRGFNENLHSVEVLGDSILYKGRPAGVSIVSYGLEGGHVLSVVYGPAVSTG